MLAGDDYPEELVAAVGGIERVSIPRQGYTSQTTVVEGGRGTFAIKRTEGERFCALLAHEHRVLTALSGTDLPVPRPVLLHRWDEPEGPVAWLVLTHLPGEHVRTLLNAAEGPEERWTVMRAFGEALALIQAVPPPPALREVRLPWLDHMFSLAAYNLAHYQVEGDPELLEILRRERPAPEGAAATLVHGDFTMDNVLLEEGKVTGIIDWSDGEVGDRRYDLAVALDGHAEEFSAEDREAFFAGYGGKPLSPEESWYFSHLYKFS